MRAWWELEQAFAAFNAELHRDYDVTGGQLALLRIIAGLEVPDSGTVLFHGEDATGTDVRERQVGFVFQHYALFRHMTVFDNVAFGLKIRKKPKAEVKAKVEQERAGRLARLDELAKELQGIEGMLFANADTLDDSFQLNSLHAALRTLRARLPDGIVAPITDQSALDAWAAAHTRGMIPAFPLQLQPSDLLILATALAAETEWVTPFTDTDGTLHRYGAQRSADILGDNVIRVIVEGRDDLDVHLLSGADTLGTGIAALAGDVAAMPASELPIGTDRPGLRVREVSAATPGDLFRLTVPAFDISDAHDLTDHVDLFGLRTALDATRGHFPGLAPDTALSRGRQSVRAQFSATGFRAAVITAFAFLAGSAPLPDEHLVRLLEIDFEPPFCFIAVHRSSGLVIVGGRISATN